MVPILKTADYILLSLLIRINGKRNYNVSTVLSGILFHEKYQHCIHVRGDDLRTPRPHNAQRQLL